MYDALLKVKVHDINDKPDSIKSLNIKGILY